MSSENQQGAQQTGILKRGLTPTHEMMADWILQNPGGTYRQMSAHFGYSVSWLCQVCNSDFFKAFMSKRLGEVHASVTQSIPKQLEGVATLAIERITDVLENSEDPDTIIDAFDKVMHRAGYAPNKSAPAGQPPVQQNNVFFLSKDDLQQLKGNLVQAHAKPLPLPVDTQEAEIVALREPVSGEQSPSGP